jgi:hypothetical protein
MNILIYALDTPRTLHDEELHNLKNDSSNIFRVIKSRGGKPEGKRPHGTPRGNWELVIRI